MRPPRPSGTTHKSFPTHLSIIRSHKKGPPTESTDPLIVITRLQPLATPQLLYPHTLSPVLHLSKRISISTCFIRSIQLGRFFSIIWCCERRERELRSGCEGRNQQAKSSRHRATPARCQPRRSTTSICCNKTCCDASVDSAVARTSCPSLNLSTESSAFRPSLPSYHDLETFVLPPPTYRQAREWAGSLDWDSKHFGRASSRSSVERAVHRAGRILGSVLGLCRRAVDSGCERVPSEWG